MTGQAGIANSLAARLAFILHRAEPGLCVRVDHLSETDTAQTCAVLRADLQPDELAGVLGDEATGELYIAAERAIEIRNRKVQKLCLFVPPGTVAAEASSLQNAFAAFDLNEFLNEHLRELLTQLPADVHALVRQALAGARGLARATIEQKVAYVSEVLERPTAPAAGEELWRLGLLPDLGGEQFAARLEDNRRCINELCRPARAQTTVSDRLAAARLQSGTVREELLAFLSGHRLRNAREWLGRLVREPHRGRITFEQWSFESADSSDLQAIELEPFLDDQGAVQSWSYLRQDGGPGSPLTAIVGATGKVVVRWSSQPEKPQNLKAWRIELIPSRDEYAGEDLGAEELPATKANGKARKATVKLGDLDLESMAIRAVQVRVVAVDSGGLELRDKEGRVVEGLSQEFWLEQKDVAEEDPGPSKKRETALNLPLARLKAALELPVEQIEESVGQWQEKDLHYYAVTLSGRRVVRVALSAVLRRLEELALKRDGSACAFSATVDAASILDPDRGAQIVDLPELATIAGHEKFRIARRDMFDAILGQKERGYIETASWTEELTRGARSYLKAWVELLRQASTAEQRSAVLRIDTLALNVQRESGNDPSIIVLPIHPLRVMWYAAYVELLRAWETQLLKVDKKQRSKQLDFDLLRRIEPVNCPAFVPAARAELACFSQNLWFFWAILLPVNVRDPARRHADIARVLGFPAEDSPQADLSPDKLAREFQAYSEVHPYLDTLRLNLLNVGSGAFVADALRHFCIPQVDGDESEDASPLPRVELFVHAPPPLPFELPVFERLQRELYALQPTGRRSYLSPYFSVALRPTDAVTEIPGGDVNISLVVDHLLPSLLATDAANEGSSDAFYGLLLRLLPHFDSSDGGVTWSYSYSLPEKESKELHPVDPGLTRTLLDAQRAILTSCGGMLSPAVANPNPCIQVRITPEHRVQLDRIHHISDWVITLDRFFGVEFYDHPADPHVAGVAQKYLLDYAPEFLDGLGHRMLVTTAHREEVEEILSRAMSDLGFGDVENSVGEVLHSLKTISGRLALRILGDDNRAREAVSLGVVATYLRSRGELDDSVLIPVDTHPEVFDGGRRTPRAAPGSRQRCDLIRIRFLHNRLEATFIEVKSRAAAGQTEELRHRIVDQIENTERTFDDLFFRNDPPRLDQVLQRSRLASLLQFYLGRARRYGLLTSQDAYTAIATDIENLDRRFSKLKTRRWGFIVSLDAKPQRVIQLRDTEIRVLTAADLAEAGLTSSAGRTGPPRESDTGGEEPDARLAPPPGRQPKVAKRAIERSVVLADAPRPTDASNEQPREIGKARREPVGASDSAEGPAVVPDGVAVELGRDTDDDGPVTWSASVKGSPHLFILGIPGQGKSWTISRILREIGTQGLPALVIDFHGQFSADVASSGATRHVLDAAKGLPFSPFEAEVAESSGPNYWKTNCFAVAEIFEYVCKLGLIQRDVVFEALRDCYDDLGFSDGTAKRLPTVEEFYERLVELEAERTTQNVVPRCQPLIEFGLFRTNPDAARDWGTLLSEGLVIDVHNLGLEALQLAAGAFVLRKIYKDMFRWGQAERLRLAIVLDEAHRLARDVTLPKIMKEGRKFGIAVLVASQGLADYHPDVVGNAGTKVVFRTNFPMSKKVAGFLRGPAKIDLAAAIEQLDVGEAFVQTPSMSHAARVRLHPLTEPE